MKASFVCTNQQSSINYQTRDSLSIGKMSCNFQKHQIHLSNSDNISNISPSATTINKINKVIKSHTLSHENTDIVSTSATVFIEGNVSDSVISTSISHFLPQTELKNKMEESIVNDLAANKNSQDYQNYHMQKSLQIVEVQINPKVNKNTSKIISAAKLNFEDFSPMNNLETNNIRIDNTCSTMACVHNSNNNNFIDINKCNRYASGTTVNSNNTNINTNSQTYINIDVMKKFLDCVSINKKNDQDTKISQSRTILHPLNSSSCCFYYAYPLNVTVMSSGQKSLTETVNSDTSSDFDIKSPVPTKNDVMIRSNTIFIHNNYHPCQNYDKIISLTSNRTESSNNDNHDTISCHSLNNDEVSINGNLKFQASKQLELRTESDCINKEKSLNSEKETIYNVVTVSNIITSQCLNHSNFVDLKKNFFNKSGIFPLSSETVMLSKNSSIPIIRSISNSTSKKKLNSFSREECKQNQQSNNNVIVSFGNLPINNSSISKHIYEHDKYYKFHINERDEKQCKTEKNNNNKEKMTEIDDECFAGYKIFDKEAIRSDKGTVRGVKNRVRAGIATFLQNPYTKNYKIKDAGKVVVYTTTMGIVRETYYRCVLVKQILRTHMIKYEERDMYMSVESQNELRDRISCEVINVPQLFIDGQYIGDAEIVERLNESGELRLMLKPYRSFDTCRTCKICGGYCLLPCPVCNGSKKSIHRNDFTTEFITLKCMNCDEVGLVRCQYC